MPKILLAMWEHFGGHVSIIDGSHFRFDFDLPENQFEIIDNFCNFLIDLKTSQNTLFT